MALDKRLVDAMWTILKLLGITGAVYITMMVIILIIGVFAGAGTDIPNLENDTINNLTSFKAKAFSAVGVLADSAVFVFGLVSVVVLFVVFKDYMQVSKGKKMSGNSNF